MTALGASSWRDRGYFAPIQIQAWRPVPGVEAAYRSAATDRAVSPVEVELP